MAFIECMKPELDLFKHRSIQTNILKTEEIAYKPLTSLENQSVIEFSCQGHSDTYLDLSAAYLRLKIQVQKNDGTLYNNGDAKQPGIANNILHSLFRQVNISLNGKTITSSDGNYSYRAYIETLLNFNEDCSRTHLALSGFVLDNPTSTDNNNKNKQLIKDSSVVELYGKLHTDMLNQPLLLLNNVELRVTLTLNKPEFILLNEEGDECATSMIKILEASLYMKHCTINPNVLIAHHKMLENTNAKYHYKHVEVKTFTVSQGGTSLNLDNIVVLGQLPTTLIFFMVDNDAFTGSYKKDPYKFNHNNISSCSLYVNGVPVPNEPYITDFKRNTFSRAYASIHAVTGILNTSETNLISKEMFSNGYFMLAFDLTPDLSGSMNCSSSMNQGNIRLEARFDTALTNSLTCLVYMEFDRMLEIDKNRNVILDF